MKYTFANGDVLDDITSEDLPALLKLVNSNSKPKVVKREKAFEPAPEPKHSLTRKQQETYDFLVENDKAEGVSVDAVAKRLSLNHTTAYHRLYHLVGLGMARQVNRGTYRAMQ